MSTVKEKEPTKETKEWVMPKIAIGHPVRWFADATSDACAALVTQVGTKGISVSVFHPSQYNATLKDGVRHISDPNREKALITDEGLWDYLERLD